MADIFFFTDPALLTDQLNDTTSGKAFGPISDTHFQITSQHKAAGAKAIAVCGGSVVGIDNGSFITLILRPISKIKELTTLDLPEIKYIIYKGIKRNSLIDLNDTIPVKIAPSISNDLTRKIWETQLKYNADFIDPNDPQPDAPLGALRLDAGLTANESIDKLFLVPLDSVFEPQIVDAGDYIGDFIDGTGEVFGIEFVFNELRTKVTCQEAKNNDFKIDVGTVPSAGTGKDNINRMRQKNYKERVLRFMDPAAFYGSLFSISSNPDKNDNKKLSIKRTDGTVESFEGKLVYEKLLFKFFNRNRIYFDIRNEYNASFNFLGVYGNKIKLKLGKDSDFEYFEYYVDFKGWPLIGIDLLNTDNNVVYDPADETSKKVKISLKIPGSVLDNDNKNPVILLYHDYLLIKNKGVQRLHPHEKLFLGKVDPKESDIFFKEIEFELPNDQTTAEDTDRVAPVSTYIRIKIFRSESIYSPDIQIHRQENYIDSLILPFACERFYDTGIDTRTFPEDVYMGTDVKIEGVINRDSGKPATDFISSVGYSFDQTHVTFFTFANRRKTFPLRKSPTEREYIHFNGVEYASSGEFLKSVSEKFTLKAGTSVDLLGEIDVLIPGGSQKLYRYLPLSDVHPDGAETAPDLGGEFSAICISKTAYEQIKEAVNDNSTGIDPNYDIHLVLRNRQNFSSTLTIDTTNIQNYSTYELWLRGFKEDAGTDPDMDTVNSQEWNSGIVLMAYSEDVDCKNKNFIFIEHGQSLTDVDADLYIPCYKTNLNPDEIVNLNKLRDRMETSTFKPNVDLYHKVFRKTPDDDLLSNERYYFNIDEDGEVYFRDYEDVVIDSLGNDQVKGFILEAATIFAAWNLCTLLADETKENYLYERLFRILINNGLKPEKANNEHIRKTLKARIFNPFHHFGPWLALPSGVGGIATPEFNYVIRPISASKNSYFAIGTTEYNSVNGVLESGDSPGLKNTSFKSELFNAFTRGYFHHVYLSGNNVKESDDTTGFGDDYKLFELPNLPAGNLLDSEGSYAFDGLDNLLNDGLRKYFEKLVGKVSNEIMKEFKFLINRNALCYYKVFTKNLKFNDGIKPQLRLLASGEGSTTKGLTNTSSVDLGSGLVFSDPGEASFGALLYTYDLAANGDVKSTNTERFPTITRNVPVAIHLTIMGMDPQNAPNIVEVELSGDSVGGPSGNKVLMRFVGEQDLPEGKRKLFPEHSLAPLETGVMTHLDYTHEQRVALEPFGTSRRLISGTTTIPDVADSDFQFVDSEGKVVGTYFAEWNNLIIKHAPPYNITVKIYSGQGLSEDDPDDNYTPYPDSVFFEEIQVGVSVFESIEVDSPTEINIAVENLYPDDKFELTAAQKRSLIDDKIKYRGSKATYKKMAKLIHEGKLIPENMFINLKGFNIGRPKSEVKDAKSDHHVIRDTRFSFSPSLSRPEFLGWVEITPSASTIKLELQDHLYHPNDVNRDRTRLLEFADWISEEYLAPLRFSFAKIRFNKIDNNTESVFIDIESFVSPKWSRLDDKVYSDYRHNEGTGIVEGYTRNERRAYLDNLTLYNNGANNSDAYIKIPIQGGGYAYQGSYNPVLSCLRSFGLMEAIRDNIVYMATHPVEADPSDPEIIADPSVLTSAEADEVKLKIQTAINNIVIKSNPEIGFTQDITYATYNILKWYYSQPDNNNYGPTI